MHTSGPAAEGREALASSDERDKFVTLAGAATAALGLIDLLTGIAMWNSAASFDLTFEGEPTATALRAYGLRLAAVGTLDLFLSWAIFAETGARSRWLVLPVGLAASDILGDAFALTAGPIPFSLLVWTAIVHEVLAASVIATGLSAWRRERSLPRGGGQAPR